MYSTHLYNPYNFIKLKFNKTMETHTPYQEIKKETDKPLSQAPHKYKTDLILIKYLRIKNNITRHYITKNTRSITKYYQQTFIIIL